MSCSYTQSVLETVKTASAGPVKPTMDLRCTQDTLFIMTDTATEAYCVICTHSHLCSHQRDRTHHGSAHGARAAVSRWRRRPPSAPHLRMPPMLPLAVWLAPHACGSRWARSEDALRVVRGPCARVNGERKPESRRSRPHAGLFIWSIYTHIRKHCVTQFMTMLSRIYPAPVLTLPIEPPCEPCMPPHSPP